MASLPFRLASLRRNVVLTAVLCLYAPATALAGQAGGASTPAAMYARAQAKEQVARGAEAPDVKDLRIAATAYERLFREYPASGYADNALWQAAELLSLAYKRAGQEIDREHAERWLEWLRKEYPSSPLAKRVVAELQALQPKTPAPHAAPAPVSPASSGPASSGPASIRSVTTTPLPQGQRISIEFSQEVRFVGDRVDGPDRVFFDFTNASISTAVTDRAQAINGAFVKNVRVGHPSTGITRFVLDLSGKPRYSSYTFYDPFRLVVDVVDAQAPTSTLLTKAATPESPVSTVAGPAANGAARAVASSSNGRRDGPASTTTSPAAASTTHSGDYTLGRQLGLGVSRIVIDAGHGGHDPGAMANGVTEAELVLDIAQRVEKLLNEMGGFQVVLTRKTDEFIALEERTAIANRQGPADLFLSIHANASPDPATRGIETYFLNLASNQTEAAVAARENATSAQTMGMLPELVKAIALNDKMKESRELAGIVQTSMMRKMSMQNKALKDLGVKQAPFRVLIGAHMPSVLAEISFLTNKNEASLLKQSSFRQRIATSLADAIVSYQGSLKKVTTIAAKDGGR